MRKKGIELGVLVLVVVLFSTLPLALSPFYIRVLQNIFFAASLAVAWQILGGFAGYWSFGQSGFVGVGAFSAALFQEHVHLGSPALSLMLGIVLGACLSALLAAIISYPVLRLRGAYFAIAMFGVALILSELASNVDIFEGNLGIQLAAVGPASLAPETFYYYVLFAALLASLLVGFTIKSSKLYYGLAAIREDEDTAPMLGVPTTYYKIVTFIISSALTGAIGAIYAYSLGYITAESGFRASVGLDVIVYCLLGGVGTLFGPIVGATVFVLITQVLLGHLLHLHLLITGVLLVLTILLIPEGILGTITKRAKRGVTGVPVDPTSVRQEYERRPGPQANVTGADGDARILELSDISVQFKGLRALDSVSLAVSHGTICSIIGPNGAGKSTLFNVVTGYITPSKGTVSFRGRRIDTLDTAQLSHVGIGRAFQISKPFRDLTVYENVKVGALFGRREIKRDAELTTIAALKTCGLMNMRDDLASSLPIGHLRRLELARVIATDSELILADEPCAGLNATETSEVAAILVRLREMGKTIVLVEHDMTTIMKISDYVYVISAGQKISEGKPLEVAHDPRVIEAYLGKPLDPSRNPISVAG